MTAEPRRYTFHPLERRGIIVGLSGSQLVTFGIGALLALIAVRVAGRGLGVGVALLLLISFVAAGVLPIAGRPASSWVPITIRWGVRRVTGPQVNRAPGQGKVVGRPAREVLDDVALPGLELVDVPSRAGDGPVGLLRDRRAGTWAAVIPVRGRSFALLDRTEKERRLESWGSVLAGLARARSPVVRVQWVERSALGDGDELREYLDAAARPASTEALRSYNELVEAAGPATQRHQVLLVLVVAPRRGRAERAGSKASDVVRREVRLLGGRLRSAELATGEALSPEELRRELLDAIGGRMPERKRRGAGGGPPWAMATDEAWAAVRTDRMWHATYWIAEWPRLDVPPDFLGPLLLTGGARAVSVTFGPVPPDRAARQVESARTADAADDELRRRAGFLDTARRRRQAEGVLQRERELADGHAEYRFSGYVTVSGADAESLEAACAEIEQAAEAAHLQLRRLYGQQLEAFTWTLPLGRGLS